MTIGMSVKNYFGDQRTLLVESKVGFTDEVYDEQIICTIHHPPPHYYVDRDALLVESKIAFIDEPGRGVNGLHKPVYLKAVYRHDPL